MRKYSTHVLFAIIASVLLLAVGLRFARAGDQPAESAVSPPAHGAAPSDTSGDMDDAPAADNAHRAEGGCFPALDDLIGAPDIDAQIERFPFYPITEEALPELLRSIPAVGLESMSEVQLEEFYAGLAESVWAYKVGSDELILSSLLRADYTILPEGTTWHLSILDRFYRRPGEEFPSDPEDIMRLLVSRNYGGENGDGYAGLYSRLSPDGSEIVFKSSDEMPTPITDQLRLDRELGVRAFRRGLVRNLPSVAFHKTPEDLLAEYGKLQFADVRLAADDADGVKYSRFKRYYWSPDDAAWLLMETVSANAGPRKADSFF